MMVDVNIARIRNFINRHIESVKSLEGGVPPFSSIEFSNNALCNRRCVFCPRVDVNLFPDKNEHLSFDLFKKVINELAIIDYCGRIAFSGFCEPLLTGDLERYIGIGKERCPKMTIEIVTNGDPLTTERLQSLFKAGLDNIRVSLYDGPSAEERFNTMRRVLNLTNKQFIIRRRNLSPEEHYGLTISNRAGALTLKNDKVNIGPLEEPLKQPCFYPFYKLFIDYNGDVMMCSNDWLKRLIIGNVNTQTIFESWTAEELDNVRKQLIMGKRSFPPCDVCDVNGLFNGEIHFNTWVKYYKDRKMVVFK